jgi:hypothetical protein
MACKVIAKRKVKYNGVKYNIGDEIDVLDKDAASFRGAGKIISHTPDQSVSVTISKLTPRLDVTVIADELIDWLLDNIEEIKDYVKELAFIGEISVSGLYPAEHGTSSPIEKSIITVDDCKIIIRAAEDAVHSLESDVFDIYVARFCDSKKAWEIHHLLQEKLSLSTIQRRIISIREIVLDYIVEQDKSLNDLLWMRRKMRHIEKNYKKTG